MATEMATKNGAYGLKWLLGVLAVATVVSATAARPEASVPWIAACGSVLSGDETYVLTEDVLDCDASAPAITVIGPATLRLNGHTVSCALELDDEGQEVPQEGTIGVRLEGKDAGLVGGGKPAQGNGTPANLVTGCAQGVVLNGEGEHEVRGVSVTRSADGAFVIESDENKLVGNVVRQAEAWDDSEPLEGSGFLVAGDKNKLQENVAADNDSDDEAGFTVEGNENELKDNISKDNVGFGYLVLGHLNILRGNAALKNEQHGFVVGEEAEGNVLKHNKSFENGDEPNDPEEPTAASGFEIDGSGNELDDNIANRNGIYGIHLTGTAHDNVISHNAVADNLEGDLIDETLDCNSNEWHKNIFGTRSQGCIR
jgi:parallel beta-helix repeat protein